MISCAISLPEADWQQWLHAMGNMRIVRDLELPVSLLQDVPDVLPQAEQQGFHLLHAHDLLPSDVARYLSESSVRGSHDLLTYLRETVVNCQLAGARYVSMEMGLDRIGEHTFEVDLGERVKLLRALMPAADQHRITLCLQVRYPRSFPGCRDWEYAGNLVHEVMHPNCRLAVNLFPNDLPPDFDIDQFVATSYFHVAVIRFHYSPMLGESLETKQQRAWAAALQKHAFKGVVIFCPKTANVEGAASACADVDGWAEYYADSF